MSNKDDMAMLEHYARRFLRKSLMDCSAEDLKAIISRLDARMKAEEKKVDTMQDELDSRG